MLGILYRLASYRKEDANTRIPDDRTSRGNIKAQPRGERQLEGGCLLIRSTCWCLNCPTGRPKAQSHRQAKVIAEVVQEPYPSVNSQVRQSAQRKEPRLVPLLGLLRRSDQTCHPDRNQQSNKPLHRNFLKLVRHTPRCTPAPLVRCKYTATSPQRQAHASFTICLQREAR